MARGGHARSGPPPDPNALRRSRRSDKVSYTPLPARRDGPTPPWPLPRPRKRELTLWTAEWTRPQAVMWEQLGLELVVAIYVRTFCAAEEHDAPVTLRTLLRQQMDDLGLTVAGLARNRWTLTDDDLDPVDRPTSAPDAPDAAPSGRARDRFRVLAG